MKTASVLLLVLLVCLFTSCATTSVTVDPATGANFVRVATSIAVYEGLKNNPAHASGAIAIVAGIDAALSGGGIVSDETVTAFVQKIAAKNNLDPVETVLLSGAARTAFQAFSSRYHVSEILITDANAVLYVSAFRDGVKDAVLMLDPK